MLATIAVLLLILSAALAVLCLEQRRRFRRRLADAELGQLRAQLNPHFLFNTLNAISELGYDDPEAADRAITRLSGLLRKSFDESHGLQISLKAEIDFLEDYLALQRMLMRDTLDIDMSIDPRVLHARVPTMILQPLVENALIHGRNAAGANRIAISASLLADMLVIDVSDNGQGLQPQPPAAGRAGIGIANAEARLQHLYGAVASIALRSGADGGATARIVLPFRELP
jgi:two-component system LytT family sensor kinase